MLVNTVIMESIPKTDYIREYRAFVIQDEYLQGLYIKVPWDNDTLSYFIIQDDGHVRITNPRYDAKFDAFRTDVIAYPVDISSIQCEKVLYRTCSVEEARNEE